MGSRMAKVGMKGGKRGREEWWRKNYRYLAGTCARWRAIKHAYKEHLLDRELSFDHNKRYNAVNDPGVFEVRESIRDIHFIESTI